MTEHRKGDVVAAIKAAVDPANYHLHTAEGRAEFDSALRAEVDKITDDAVRAHAGDMIRYWRRCLFAPPAFNLDSAEGRADFSDALDAVIARISDRQLRHVADGWIRKWQRDLYDHQRGKR